MLAGGGCSLGEGLVSVAVGVVAIFMLPDRFKAAWCLSEDDKQLAGV